MSVGGCIIDIVPVTAEKWWVNTYDKHTQCAVYVNPQGRPLAVGDSLWWQGRHCYWTPQRVESAPQEDGLEGRCGVDFDIALPKIGFSGVNHPHKPRSLDAGEA